jgi:hypothetical protein
MDSARNVINTAVLNSDVVQTFSFTEIDTCSVMPIEWFSSQTPHSAVFLSDSVIAVLSQPAHDHNADCPSQLHFIRIQSATRIWNSCVNVSLTEGATLLFDRDQRSFSLLESGSIKKFDAKGILLSSQPLNFGDLIASNQADTVETDISVIVARDDFYSHCNLFTGACMDLVSRVACGPPGIVVTHGLRAYFKCQNLDDLFSSVVSGCESSTKLAIRLSGCVQQRSNFISTMNLYEVSDAEAEWLWAVSSRYQDLFSALSKIRFAAPMSSFHCTTCAEVFGLLTYIHDSLKFGWLLQSSTRRHLDFLGTRHSIFVTLPCIGGNCPINHTAVIETLDHLRLLHPWPHVLS